MKKHTKAWLENAIVDSTAHSKLLDLVLFLNGLLPRTSRWPINCFLTRFKKRPVVSTNSYIDSYLRMSHLG